MPPTLDLTTGSGLLDALRNLRRRVRLLKLAYGAGIVLAAAIGLVLSVVLIDYVLRLPIVPRVVVNLSALAVLGYAGWVYIVRPALAKLTLSDLAGRLESTFPQFDDTLRSTVIFSEQQVPGSPLMQQRTAARAGQIASGVDLRRAIALKPVYGSLSLAAGALVTLVLLAWLAGPTLRGIAARRLFAGSVPWPKSTQIDLLQKPGARVAAGSDVGLRLRLAKGDKKQATIMYRFDSGPWQTEILTADGQGVFAARLKAQLDAGRDLSQMQIRAQAGDDELELPAVAVVPPLEIRQATAVVAPPSYSKLPPTEVNLSERSATAAVGSHITLNVTFNKLLNVSAGVRLEASDPARALPPVQWTFPRNGMAVGSFDVAETFKTEDAVKFVVRASDADGFVNQTPQEYQIVVREDAKPAVMIEEPRQSDDRTPDATVPLRIAADDDYGFDTVDLVVEGKGPNLAAHQPWVIPLVRDGQATGDTSWQPAANSTIDRRRFVAEYAWDLSKLQGVTLKPGDKLEYFVRVRDNFDLAGKRHDPVDSSRLTISIISHDQFDAWVELQLSNIRQEIGSIKKNVDVTKAGAEQQAKETAEQKKLDDAQKTTMNRLANQQATATAQTKQSSQKLQDLVRKMAENKAPEQGAKQAADQVAKQLDRTAESSMKEATNQLNEAKDTKSEQQASAKSQEQSAQQAAQSLQKATQQQQQASQQLEQAMKNLDSFGGLEPAIQKLQDIKQEQEKLAKEYKEKLREAVGKKPQDMTEQQKNDLKSLTDKQEKLAQETAKAIKDMGDKADKLQQADPAASKAMKESAQAGQQQSVPQKQSSPKDDSGAAQQMQQNQQANAQQKHKEIELGLEMMLDKLKEAEKAKLEQLQKDLAQLQQLLGDLVARQAGHNIDNLFLQNPKKLSDLSEADRDALFTQARRDVAKLAELKPELAILTPSQEQTYRNTVDVAKKAQAMPDASPAGKINAAAAKMEQAIVYLRKNELAAAYQPPQVEALKNLLEAKKIVDDAKKKSDDEEEQKKEETIRQAFVRLLEDQKKLDAETTDIDKNGKDEEGNLKRSASARLSAMPGEQGKLADRAEKIGENLKTVKSVVYVWANKDIVNSMNEVKQDLSKPQTDAVVQAEQKRIEEQLDAMIRNLAKKKPKDDGFAKRDGGGGEGKGQKPPPRMPTEAEIQLLKDLQEAVNKSTTVIDGEVKKAGGKKDAEKLLSLGGRQGELRNLLDQLIKGATDGQLGLNPEPDPKNKLPEEADAVDIDQQELLDDLLGKKLDEGSADADSVEKTVKVVGDRMGRSRQRLALDNDPGKTTQEIQKRIVLDLNNLIKLAQQQQQQASGKPGSGEPGEQASKPQPGKNQGQQQANQKGNQQPQQQPGGQQAAADSQLSQGGQPTEDLSRELQQKLSEWGMVTQRERGAVMEGAGERTSEKYRKYDEDYRRELAKKATER